MEETREERAAPPVSSGASWQHLDGVSPAVGVYGLFFSLRLDAATQFAKAENLIGLV